MGAPASEAAEGGEESSAEETSPGDTPRTTVAEFQIWKQKKDAEAAVKAAEAARKRAEDLAAGRVRMNGRELYHAEPWVFDDARFE